MKVPILLVLFLSAISTSAQIITTCSLYGNTAYCSSYDHGALVAEQQKQQYETGQAVGAGIGMAIFRAHFPGWRRKHCSQHPGQPFDYRNAKGDAITGTCPSQDVLANEAATEWMAKNLKYKACETNGKAIDAYIAEKRIARWEPKSYDQAYKALLKEKKLEI